MMVRLRNLGFIVGLLLISLSGTEFIAKAGLNLGSMWAIKETGWGDDPVDHILWGSGLRLLFLSNIGSRNTFKAVVETWDLFESDNSCELSARTKETLNWTLSKSTSSFLAWRILSRSNLCEDFPEKSLETIMKRVRTGKNDPNPLLWVEIGDIYKELEKPSQAVEAYAHVDFLGRVEQGAEQNLEIALRLKKRNDLQGSVQAIDRGLELLPGNLCLLNQRYWLALKNTGSPSATSEALKDQLAHFDLDAVAPRLDTRLRVCDVDVVSQLVEEKIWSKEKLISVISYKVWRFPIEETELFLNELLSYYPKEVDILFHLGELYQRMEVWDKSQSKYRQVLGLDPNYAKAYLRLGIVLQEMCGDDLLNCEMLSEIETNYRHYLDLRPDDLLGLKKLVEFYSATHDEEENTFRAELNRRTEDLQIAAELFGVSLDQISLGPNLIENGGFENWLRDRPEWWSQYTNVYQDGVNDGVLVAEYDEIDAFEGSRSGRMQTLWVKQDSEYKPAAIVWHHRDESEGNPTQILLSGERIYMLSFYYREYNAETNPWFGPDPDIPFKGEVSLLPTDGDWRKLVAIDLVPSDQPASIMFSLRLWNGVAWWDSIEIRELIVSPASSLKSIPLGMWIR